MNRIATALSLLVLGTTAGIGVLPGTPVGASSAGIPEGVYRTAELTRGQLLATGIEAGFAEADVVTFLDGDGMVETATLGVRLADGGWSLLYAYNGEPEAVGWRGTYEVVDEDTVIATDPCGAITYTYGLDGDELTLDMVDDQCDDGVYELIAQTVLYESAPFVKETEPADPGDAGAAGASYTSTSLVIPFEVALPEWLPAEPSAVLPNFVTWEATDVDRGVRFLAPLSVYPPGSDEPAPVPDDYLTYLLGQAEHGAEFADVVETNVDGHPATVLTATVPDSLDGSLGCQADDLSAADCFGLQPDVIIRMAVIDVDGQTLLVWVRDIRGDDSQTIEYDSFDAMLASIRFLDEGAPTTTTVTENLATPIDGEWQMELSYEELAGSPLLYDEHEINEFNWGTFTLTFEDGRFTETQSNPDASWSGSGTYRVEGDVLYLDRDDGEHFIMRWSIEGDTLRIERDESLGVVPTPFILEPWSRTP